MPKSGPDGPSISNNGLQQDIVGVLDLLIPIKVLLNPMLQQTLKVLWNVEVLSQMITANLLVRLDPVVDELVHPSWMK
jgi:hypothetical protein